MLTQHKETQKRLCKILVLSDLLVEEIDKSDAIPNKGTKLIQDRARDLQELLIPVVDSFYAQKEVSKTSLFLRLAEKFNYIFDKEYR